MAILANVPATVAVTTTSTNYLIFTRNAKGDTAYATDSDAADAMYSVSNPAWVTANILTATTTAPTGVDNLGAGLAGGGAPTANCGEFRGQYPKLPPPKGPMLFVITTT